MPGGRSRLILPVLPLLLALLWPGEAARAASGAEAVVETVQYRQPYYGRPGYGVRPPIYRPRGRHYRRHRGHRRPNYGRRGLDRPGFGDRPGYRSRPGFGDRPGFGPGQGYGSRTFVR